MNCRLFILGAAAVTLLSSCSAPQVQRQSQPQARSHPPSQQPGVPEPEPRPKETVAAPLTLAGFQMEFALRVAGSSPDIFQERLPEVLKSVVVLDITIDRNGRLLGTSVRRSNGYTELERVAQNSVRRAAPFAAPTRRLWRSDGTVHFLETFLFRNDGRFQIRTLVTESL
jgi:protein TonB